MGTPVTEFRNPFEDHATMADRSQGATPRQDRSRNGSMEGSEPQTPNFDKPREKKRVGFTGDSTPRSASLTPGGSGGHTPAERHNSDTAVAGPSSLPDFRSHLPHLSLQDAERIREVFAARMARPRPALRNSLRPRPSMVDSEDDSDGLDDEKAYRRRKAREALQRGKALEEENVRTLSEPVSPSTSSEQGSVVDRRPSDLDLNQAASAGSSTVVSALPSPELSSHPTNEALLRKPSFERPSRDSSPIFRQRKDSAVRSGTSTPVVVQQSYEDYQPRPRRYHASLLGAMLDLRDRVLHHDHSDGEPSHRRIHERPIGPMLGFNQASLARKDSRGDFLATSPEPTPYNITPTDSGTSTPRGLRSPWYFGSRQHSFDQAASFEDEVSRRLRKHKEAQKRPSLGERIRSSSVVDTVNKQIRRTRKQEEHRIKLHISAVLQRQKYLLKLCRALMTYGAPTHRLEEYLNMSARALQVDAHFLYLPNAMIISFQDPTTHTTQVQLVKEPSGLDLGRMRDLHEVYKEVVHDRISAFEGLQRIHAVTSRPYGRWNRTIRFFFYGIASLSVGPFAFNAQWIDLPMCFVLGCIVGGLHLYVAERNTLVGNVFEILAAIVTSCLARLLGSIQGGQLFCFAALAQSSLALILPGYMVLMASLELQSRHFIAGSVRMVHAIIYSLTLGFGITIGTALAGILPIATSDMTCGKPIPKELNSLFVLIFTISLMVINHASWTQAPSMIIISLIGYNVNYYSSKRFQPTAQIASTLGALTIGMLANGYSRFSPRVTDWWDAHLGDRWTAFWSRRKSLSSELEDGALREKQEEQRRRLPRVGRSLAAAVMLPAILVQVPSGISIAGSLVSGLEAANLLTSSLETGNAQVGGDQSGSLNTTAFTVGFSVIQVALGITVGLFVSAILMYPMGKRRSALFSL